jgi:leucyl aminopeptidase
VFQKTILTGKRMADLFAPTGAEAIKTYICTKETAEAVLTQLSDAQQKTAQFHGFDGGLGQALVVHAAEQPIALLGIGNDAARKRGRFALAAAAAKLPDGIYQLCNDDALEGNSAELVGWFIDQYRFDRYKTIKRTCTTIDQTRLGKRR